MIMMGVYILILRKFISFWFGYSGLIIIMAGSTSSRFASNSYKIDTYVIVPWEILTDTSLLKS